MGKKFNDETIFQVPAIQESLDKLDHSMYTGNNKVDYDAE